MRPSQGRDTGSNPVGTTKSLVALISKASYSEIGSNRVSRAVLHELRLGHVHELAIGQLQITNNSW